MAPDKKIGNWKGKDLTSFKEFRDAIEEMLDAQPPHTAWVVELEVKKNPIHDYRIILSPGP
jgi:hypothetical protein